MDLEGRSAPDAYGVDTGRDAVDWSSMSPDEISVELKRLAWKRPDLSNLFAEVAKAIVPRPSRACEKEFFGPVVFSLEEGDVELGCNICGRSVPEGDRIIHLERAHPDDYRPPR